MTILTQALSEKKLQSKTPNEIRQPLVDDSDDLPSGPQVDIENGSTSSLTSHRSRAQRLNSLTTLCVTLTALLVLTTGIVGGIYLYRQFAQYRLRHFRGWCSIPINESPSIEGQALHQTDEKEFDIRSLFNLAKDEDNGNSNRFFDEEFDIDLEFEQYEKIEVPELPDFSNGRRGRFIHDFSKNLTGIVDTDSDRCFILPLNRTQVLPPQSLFDLVTKMRNGYYDIDTERVRDVYRVVLPPVTDYRELGFYIGRECAKRTTYRLEPSSRVYKRSADDKTVYVFREFAGHNINEIEVEGIPESINQ